MENEVSWTFFRHQLVHNAGACEVPVITNRGGSRKRAGHGFAVTKRNCACFQENIADGLLLRQDQPAFGLVRHDRATVSFGASFGQRPNVFSGSVGLTARAISSLRFTDIAVGCCAA